MTESDIEYLHVLIQNRDIRQSNLDSVFLLINLPDFQDYSAQIYFYFAHLARRMNVRFIPNNATLSQLKNSGNLRLVRNKAVADKITKYDVSSIILSSLMELEDVIVEDYRASAYKVLNSTVLDKIIDSNNNLINPTDNPPLGHLRKPSSQPNIK